jgi:hypothetical protein
MCPASGGVSAFYQGIQPIGKTVGPAQLFGSISRTARELVESIVLDLLSERFRLRDFLVRMWLAQDLA